MASTFSDLKIELIGTGEQVGTWGTTTNANLGTAIEEAVVGSADVSFSSADVTLTLTNTNGTQTARHLRLNLTGISGGARNLILGSGCQIDKPYIIANGLADTVTVKNTTGTGVAVPAGKTMWVYNNGTNVVDVTTHLSSLTLGSALPVASGGTGLTALGTGVATALGQNVTGSGGIVLATSPTLTTPALGTPSSGTLTSCTGLPLSTGVTGTLPVGNGGTGSTTFTAGTYLKGNGTSAIATQSGIPGADITSGNINAARITTALNASGSAPIYACRAWVYYTASGNIVASGNVSSVSKFSTGNWTINFAAAMPDGAYVSVGCNNGLGSSSNYVSGSGTNYGALLRTTTACSVATVNNGSSGADSSENFWAFFR
jgi:hypothetical protein